MKKVAVLIYEGFCNFEFSIALEMLAMAKKPITVFAKSLSPCRSEEGLLAIADKPISDLAIDEYDSLLLTGVADLKDTIEDEDILAFIKGFDRHDITIGAISIAPVLLLKLGMLKGKRFMAGVDKSDLYEEGFTEEDLAHMVGWSDNIENPVADGYIQDGNIITSISYGYAKWAIAFGRALNIEVYPRAFGLDV